MNHWRAFWSPTAQFGLVGSAATLGVGQTVQFTRVVRATAKGSQTHTGTVVGHDTAPDQVGVSASGQVTITVTAGKPAKPH